MKKLISALLVCAFLTGCAATGVSGSSDTNSFFSDTQDRQTDLSAGNSVVPSDDSAESDSEVLEDLGFSSMDDPELLNYIEHEVYQDLIEDLNSDTYFIENVDAVYISKEYAEELAYNSESNVYYGFTLAELDEVFQGTRYVFTLGDSGQTVVQEFQQYDDSYNRMIANVAIGSGVILVCVAVTIISRAAGATAVSLIFAASAKTGTICALSSGVMSGVTTGVVKGIETKDVSEAVKAAAMEGSKGFMWGAIGGAVSGAASESIKYAQAVKVLKGVELNGLTPQQAAAIQMESGYPVDVIKQFSNVKQYEICKNAGMVPQMVNGKTALVRKIDLDLTDEFGRSNLTRMQKGLAAIDETGQSFELHHIGQKADSTLAMLTDVEHMKNGNNKIWHKFGSSSEVHGSGNSWDSQREAFWKALADDLIKEGIK